VVFADSYGPTDLWEQRDSCNCTVLSPRNKIHINSSRILTPVTITCIYSLICVVIILDDKTIPIISHEGP
jgi:hypothetical protein